MRLFLVTIFTFLLLSFGYSYSAQAQTSALPIVEDEKAVEPRVIFYGVKTTFAEIERQSLADSGLYCAQVITREIAQRGYFDARSDYVVCFHTDQEAKAQADANVPIIRQYATEPSYPARSNFLLSVCDGQNRGTMFQYISYSHSWGTVCTSRTTQYVGGVTMRSVWLEGGSEAAICVRMNQYPWPLYQYVNFSSIAYQFLYVAEYKWKPVSCS